MTDQQLPTTGRNPGPRPALRRDGTDSAIVVARPGTGGGASPVTPTRVEGSTDSGVKSKDKKRSKGDPPNAPLSPIKTAKQSKHDKHPKRHKDGKPERGKHAGEAEHADGALVIALPKSVRKALKHAASEHGTTPERLVSLVISEWLDH